MEYGHPRNDVLFSESDSLDRIKTKVYNDLKIEEGIRTVLYAPTFRDDYDNYSVYDLDYSRLVTTMEERFGGKWAVVIRLHTRIREYNVRNNKVLSISDEVYDASDYSDIMDLIVACDAGITD